MFSLVCIILKRVNNISRIINSGIFYSYTIVTMKDPYKEYFINQTHILYCSIIVLPVLLMTMMDDRLQ